MDQMESGYPGSGSRVSLTQIVNTRREPRLDRTCVDSLVGPRSRRTLQPTPEATRSVGLKSGRVRVEEEVTTRTLGSP